MNQDVNHSKSNVPQALGFWDMYKESPEGKRVIDLFDLGPVLDAAEQMEHKGEMFYGWAKGIYDFACGKTPELFPKSYKTDFPADLADEFMAMIINMKEDSGTIDEMAPPTREVFERFVDTYYLSFTNEKGEEVIYQKASDFRAKSSSIHVLSLALFFWNPFFVPMLYYGRFDIIQSSCARLGIELPALPRTSHYKEYLMYYYDICVAINTWAAEHQLNDAEMCACLYDYAPRFASAEEGNRDLPKPTNVWFVGADKGDFETIDDLADPTPHFWQCNDRVLRGDIVVVYCRTPRSYIHSIWRAACDGIYNPFDNYTSRTLLVNGIRIPEITHKELREHPYFKEVPIVRKNLQGIGRTELTATDYDELLKWVDEKGGDVDALPKLYDGSRQVRSDIKLEKDVEEKILIPVLEDLGYVKGDWVRQLKYKKGRGISEIPDFVLLPEGEELHVHSPLMIEAKLHMKTSKERAENFSQAYSYARTVYARYLGICDKIRLVLFERNAEGCYDQSRPVFDEQWAVILNDTPTFSRLAKLIGKSVLQHK